MKQFLKWKDSHPGRRVVGLITNLGSQQNPAWAVPAALYEYQAKINSWSLQRNVSQPTKASLILVLWKGDLFFRKWNGKRRIKVDTKRIEIIPFPNKSRGR